MFKAISFSLVGVMVLGCGHKKDDKKPAATVEATVRPSPVTPPVVIEKDVTLGELVCKEKGGFITDCKFNDRTMALKQTVLTKFTLSYNFNCIGDTLPIVIDFDGTVIPLKQQLGVTTVLYGYGPFEIKDSDSKYTTAAYIQIGCKLEFTEFKMEAA